MGYVSWPRQPPDRRAQERAEGAFGPAFGVGGEAFVEPRVAALVVADEAIEPLVGELVGRRAADVPGPCITCVGYSIPR